MRRLPLLLLSALALLGGTARAQPAPSGPTVQASLAVGGETGMASGKSGLLELELAAGWEFQATRLRPELAVAFGVTPESAIAFRPGLRAGLAEVPVWLRAAIDFSTARRHGLHARWALFGGAWEFRVNSALAFDLGIDFGIPMASSAGVPILLRAGGTFRL